MGPAGVRKLGEHEVRNFAKLMAELPTEDEWVEMRKLGSDHLLREVMAVFGHVCS